MAIAQMNWGRMRYALQDPRMSEFSDALDEVFRLAEDHRGFIWRVPDEDALAQLKALGFDDRISATVSVWEDVSALQRYTFETVHGDFIHRAAQWFEKVQGPQLVIWDVPANAQPSFQDGFERLDHLKRHGDTQHAFGWPG